MMQVPWDTTAAVFVGTLPMLGVMMWSLAELKEIRKEISLIRVELTKLTEHVAVLDDGSLSRKWVGR